MAGENRSPVTMGLIAAGVAVIAAGLSYSALRVDAGKSESRSAGRADPTSGWVVVPTPKTAEPPAVPANPVEPATIEAPPEVEPPVAPPPVAPPPPAAEPEEEPPWPLDRGGIAGAMRAHLGEIEECYEGWLLEMPDLAGRIVVEIELTGDPGDATATVASAGVVESDIRHEAMDACVLNVVEGIPFEPPPDGRLVFKYPFAFDTE